MLHSIVSRKQPPPRPGSVLCDAESRSAREVRIIDNEDGTLPNVRNLQLNSLDTGIGQPKDRPAIIGKMKRCLVSTN